VSAENGAPDDGKPSVPSNVTVPTPRVNGKDLVTRPLQRPIESPAMQQYSRDSVGRTGPPSNLGSANSTPVPTRPDSRGGYPPQQSNRLTHTLPSRPDTQPARTRLSERLGDRPTEYSPGLSRPDARPTNTSDYGRLDRGPGSLRGRSASPARHVRPRSQDRASGITEWTGRDTREYDDRSIRPPPRDIRGPPMRGAMYENAPRDHRDNRDTRDYRERDHLRERSDNRGPPPYTNPTMEARNRLHGGPPTPNDGPPHRREAPVHHNDRNGPPPRTPINAVLPANDRTMLNPDRAAYINEDRISHDRAAYINEERAGHERASFNKDERHNERNPFASDDRLRSSGPRTDRDMRNARGPFGKDDRPHFGPRPERGTRRDEREPRRERSQSPHREERISAPYHNTDTRRDYHRDDRLPPQPYGLSRDRRDETAGAAPTGPRGGREGPPPSRVSRDMFQPSQSSRPLTHSTQDPNYGRLNQPIDAAPSVPSGPKCM